MVSNIRALTFDDEDEITGIIKSCLKVDNDLVMTDLIFNDENVSAIFHFEIFPVLFDNDPILGYFEDSKLLGFTCCSTKINKIYKLNKKVAVGVLTAIHPSFRRKGIGSKLRVSLAKACQSRGVEKFIFDIKQYNTASLQNAQKVADKLKSAASLISFKFEATTNVF